MQVGEIMSTPVITIGGEATLEDAVAEMLSNRVGSVLVVEQGLWGIITRSDILRALHGGTATLADLDAKTVMTADVVTIESTAAVETALRLMETHQIKKLPVVETFELEGIVTATDIARHQPKRVREVRETIQRRDEWTD